MSALLDYQYRTSMEVAPQAGFGPPPFTNVLRALAEGRVTVRDLSALRELSFGIHMTRGQLHAAAFGEVSPNTVKKRLEVLERLGAVTAMRWTELVDDVLIQRTAYALAENGIRLLKHHFGQSFPYRPGLGQQHLKPVLRTLVANEFRLRVKSQDPDLLQDWHMHTQVGPVARFRLGSQGVLIEAPRDEDDVFQLVAHRYIRYQADNPLLLVIAGNDRLAVEAFAALQGQFSSLRLLFTTDHRVVTTPITTNGFIWQWNEQQEANPMSLA